MVITMAVIVTGFWALTLNLLARLFNWIWIRSVTQHCLAVQRPRAIGCILLTPLWISLAESAVHEPRQRRAPLQAGVLRSSSFLLQVPPALRSLRCHLCGQLPQPLPLCFPIVNLVTPWGQGGPIWFLLCPKALCGTTEIGLRERRDCLGTLPAAPFLSTQLTMSLFESPKGYDMG